MNNDYHIYSKQIRRLYKPMSKEEQCILFPKYRNGCKKSYNTIFNSVLNFVISTAQGYRGQGIDVADLIQAGNLGVHKAIKRFDVSKDVKFYSYAQNWIRAEIMEELTKSRFLKINTGVANKKYHINKAINRLEQKLCRMPRDEEISEETGFSLSEVCQAEVLEPQQSLDADYKNNDMKLSDTISDNSNLSPENYALTSISNKIEKFVDNANIKEKKKEILKRYFGIGQNAPEDQGQISKTVQLSPERVRQMKNEALDKLKQINKTNKNNSEFYLTPHMLEA